MTGYTVHTGTSKKFVEGWDQIFGSKKSTPSKTKKKATKKAPKKKKAAKATKKKAAKAKKSRKKSGK